MENMTDAQAEDLARRIARHMPQHPACIVFDDEQIQFVKAWCNLMKRTRMVAWTSLVGAIVIGLLGMVIFGGAFKLGEIWQSMRFK